jgi:hypothetical protein
VLPRPSRLLDRRLPLCHGQSLPPRSSTHLARLRLTRHQRGFKQSTRPTIPLARGRPGGTGLRFGFPPGFAPRRPGADDARRGGDRPSSTDLELLAQHHIGLILQSCSSLTTCDLVSHDDKRSSASSSAADSRFSPRKHSRNRGRHVNRGSRRCLRTICRCLLEIRGSSKQRAASAIAQNEQRGQHARLGCSCREAVPTR